MDRNNRFLLVVFALLSFFLFTNFAFSFENTETEVSCLRSLPKANLLISIERDLKNSSRFALVEIYNKQTGKLSSRVYNLELSELFYQRFGSELKASTLTFSGKAETNSNTFHLVVRLASPADSFAWGTDLTGEWYQLNCTLETDIEQIPGLKKKISE